MQRIFGIIVIAVLFTGCSGEGDRHAHHADPADQSAQTGRSAAAQDGASGSIGDVPRGVISAFDILLDHYLQLTDDLVEGNAAEAAVKSGQLHQAAGRFLQTEMDPDLASQLEAPASAIQTKSERIAQESDVEAQRKSYEELSLAMIAMVEKLGHRKQALYHQRCPMVNGGNGDWLSTQERIMNPYHGNRMLHCGTTVRTL
jgi:hypothetical protein